MARVTDQDVDEPIWTWITALELVISPLLEDPSELNFEVTRPHKESRTIEVLISCAKVDIGRVVGKSSNTLNALRILTRAWAGRNHQEVILRVSGHVDPISSLTARKEV